jgi:hypothetical protein
MGIREGNRGDEYEQTTYGWVWKCHKEAHDFLQLIYTSKTWNRGLEAWLKLQSTCLASVRPWVQTPGQQQKKKPKRNWSITIQFLPLKETEVFVLLERAFSTWGLIYFCVVPGLHGFLAHGDPIREWSASLTIVTVRTLSARSDFM